MRLLLDTHIFLWLLLDDPKLPAAVRAAVASRAADEVFLSVASTWEAVVKYAAGKLPLPAPPAELFPEACRRQGYRLLPIDEGAISHLAGLPPLHKDPFARILIAQALQHGLTVVTVDDAVRAYPVPVLPAR